MKYPKFLQCGNWLFVHIEPDFFKQKDRPVGGKIPENLYRVFCTFKDLSLSEDLRTYEGLMAYGAVEPDDKELLRLVKY